MILYLQGNGLLHSGLHQHIITDPVYDEQPSVAGLQKLCTGNVLMFCDPLQRPDQQPDEVLFWVKTPSTKNTKRRCSKFVEEICVYRRGETFNPQHWSCMTGVFTDTILEPRVHEWQKPLSLMEKLIRIYTNPGDTVFCPFAGSGSTLIAAERCGRNSVGYEIDPERYSAGKKRLEEYPSFAVRFT